MVSDRVGDFIIRLQNASRVGTKQVSVPSSTHLAAIARKLKQLGFVESVESSEDGSRKMLIVTLAYANNEPRLRGVKRSSKPGRRFYRSSSEAHRVKGGTGARILSTSIGILSDSEARSKKVGGEDLFEIW